MAALDLLAAGLAGRGAAFDDGLVWDGEAMGFRVPWRRDLHAVIVWSDGLPWLQDVRRGLGAAGLSTIAETEVVWTTDRVPWNLHRFYGGAPRKAVAKADRVGWGPFRLLIVEDLDPVYRYLPTFSGDVRPVNARIHGVKAALRGRDGLGTRLHSSNRATEFLRDGVLLLGPERLSDVVAGGSLPPRLEQDLVGVAGWRSLDELAAVLELCGPYVLLRSFDGIAAGRLPEGSGDLDVLAASRRDLVLAAGARRHRRKRDWPHFAVRVGDGMLRLDVRELGDGQLDPRWQERVLRTAVTGPLGFRIPAEDERFFSLAHHVLVHKDGLKQSHRDELIRLGRLIGLGDSLGVATSDGEAGVSDLDRDLAGVLTGMMRSRGYRVPTVRDPGITIRSERAGALLPADLLPDGAASVADPGRHLGAAVLARFLTTLGASRAVGVGRMLLAALLARDVQRVRPRWVLASYQHPNAAPVVHRVIARARLRPSAALVRSWDGWERTVVPLARTPHVRLLTGIREGRDDGAPYLFAKAQQFSCDESEVMAHRERFLRWVAARDEGGDQPLPLVTLDGLRSPTVRVVDGVHRLAAALVVGDDHPVDVLIVT